MNSKKAFARKGLFVAISVLALGVSGAAVAATATANLTVGATVVNNCTIGTSDLTFGNYDPIVTNASASLDNTGTVTITCTSGAVAAITLGQGANADPSSTDAAPLRRMTDSVNFLSYSLFSDAGRSVVWGNTTAVDVETTGTGAADAHTVYGRVTAGQNVPAGGYSDTVVATVTF